MKNRVDEKKLTDYVLGELSPEETKEIERLIEDSAELRAEVEEIRSVTTLLTEGLAEEPAAVLAPEQKEEIRRQGRTPRHFWSYYKLAGGLVAACLVVAVYVNFPPTALEEKSHSLPSPQVLPTVPSLEESQPAPRDVPDTPPTPTNVVSAADPVATSLPESVNEKSADDSSGQRTDPEKLKAEGLPEGTRAGKQASPAMEMGFSTVRGEISDQSGAAIPGADVVLRMGGKERAKTASNESGRFRIAEVEAGEYEVAASMPGFKTSRQTVNVDKKGDVRVDATLEVGEISEVVAVTAAPPSQTLFHAEMAPKSQASPGRQVAGSVVGGVIGGIIADLPPQAAPDFNTEAYDRITENEFTRVSEKPLSTFSIDVDTASYANLRRFLNQRELPPKDSVRIEELINYFDYDYTVPKDEHPFAVHIEPASAPWNEQHLLVRFGLKGEEIDLSQRRPGNFVFLIDVSGSMRPANKLPLLKRALRLMVDNLNAEDRVAIAVYAGASGLVLPSTPCSDKEKILQALERLDAGGSTNGGAGIELAYRTAEEHLLQEGVNRVILATDGDFNIGVTNQGDLTRLIEEKARSGVFLTVLGFGMGNYKDSTLEKLADKGNGNYSYIDTLQEARKVLVEEMGGTLVTIAKDVKIQVEFNPAEVQAYRLVGYENRLLRDQDFNDDSKDAGEIGAGHTVTVFYEVVPHGVEIDLSPAVDPLKYQQKPAVVGKEARDEMLTLKLRYKEPDGDRSKLIEVPVRASTGAFQKASEDFRFAASVAGFGMLLRDSAYKGSLDLNRLLELAEDSMGSDPHGYRKEFVSLVKKARAIGDLEELER